MDSYQGDEQVDSCPSPTVTDAFYQISELKMPILRRRIFFNDFGEYMQVGYGEDADRTLNYIDKNTDYDVGLIWENIIRTVNQTDFHNRLHLNYIIDSQRSDYVGNKKIAVLAHIYYAELSEYCEKYIKNFSPDCDLYITTSHEENVKKIEEVFSHSNHKNFVIRVIENRGRDVSALLVACKDVILNGNYDYICFMHDKKMPQIKWQKAAKAFADRCFDGVAYSECYVKNIIKLFEDNPYLGAVTALPPYHERYFPVIGGSWIGNYDVSNELLKKLHYDVNINKDKQPIAPYGTIFWFRPKAMAKLLEENWDYSDFPQEPIGATNGTILHALERLYFCSVQESGYYSAYVIADKLAQYEITNLTYFVQSLNIKLLQKLGFYPNFERLMIRLNDSRNLLNNKISENISDKKINVDYNAYIEKLPTKVLFKKIIKRYVPKKIWDKLRKLKMKRQKKKMHKTEK